MLNIRALCVFISVLWAFSAFAQSTKPKPLDQTASTAKVLKVENDQKAQKIPAPTILNPQEQLDNKDIIHVKFDRAQLIKIPDVVTNIIIGNPLIADIALQANGIGIITAKGAGTTNVVMLDKKGDIVSQMLLKAGHERQQTVTVYKASERETFSCAPICLKQATIGDEAGYFGKVQDQANGRANMLQNAAKQ
jgi:Flp pilus assembly secretin CpaC